MGEKRRDKRIKEENKLLLKVISSPVNIGESTSLSPQTKDISLGGVRIHSDTYLPVDTLAKVELSLPKIHKIINVRAKVRWVKSLYDNEIFEMGLEFIDTSPDVITALLGHLYGI
jgi:c-di-GMP-binding flagellar brake protein YcgR